MPTEALSVNSAARSAAGGGVASRRVGRVDFSFSGAQKIALFCSGAARGDHLPPLLVVAEYFFSNTVSIFLFQLLSPFRSCSL